MARRKSSSNSDGLLFKGGLFALLAGVAFWLFNQFGGKKTPDIAEDRPKTEIPAENPQSEIPNPNSELPNPQSYVPAEILPASTTGEVVRHVYFALSYDEDHEQAEWVAYEITRERLNKNWAERPNTFRPDPAVRTESATPRDYSGSGYDKGHLCAAADMAFDPSAIDETFLMSNMSPQKKTFNGGVWRELEECTRDWARKFKRLYVATGPVLTRTPLGSIGFSKVTVPAAYYKVLYAPDQHKAIAFVMPNELSAKPVMDYVVTIDEVEELTGIDFFPNLLKGLNEELEGSLDKDAWPVDRQRYLKRVEDWNKK
jgi:endonuclease G